MGDTKNITTPVNKVKVVIKAWITGREQRGIDDVAMSSAEIEMKGNEPTISQITTDVVRKIEDKTIETVVISVDEKTDNIIDSVIDLHVEDYNFVIANVNKVLSDRGLSTEKKS